MLMLKDKDAQRTYTPWRWIYDAEMVSDWELSAFQEAACSSGVCYLHLPWILIYNVLVHPWIMFLKIQTLQLP